MFVKLILILLIPTVWYWVTVFAAPELASKIDNLVWMPWFSDQIRGTKDNIDWAITDIPSIDEFKSWALDIKEKFSDWVTTTKDTIDSIRGWAQTVEDTYNDAKDTFEDAKAVFEDAWEKVNQLKWVVDSVSELTESKED